MRSFGSALALAGILLGAAGADQADAAPRAVPPAPAVLIQSGALVNIDVTTGATQTKPGWAEILTGYSAPALGILSNEVYQPIPQGWTIFERLEQHFGPAKIVTVFLSGKLNNVGARGPHRICANS